MAVDLTAMAKSASRVVWQVGARAIGYGVAAWMLNLFLLAFLGPELKRFLPQGGVHAAHAGGPGALIALVALMASTLPPLLLALLFFLGFPILWVLVGKKRGFQRALQGLVDRHGEGLVLGFLDRLEAFARRLPDAPRPLAALPRYLASLEGLPGGLRGIYRFLLRRTPFRGVVENLLNQDLERLDAGTAAELARQAIREHRIQALLEPGWGMVGVLAALNLGAFVAVKVLL